MHKGAAKCGCQQCSAHCAREMEKTLWYEQELRDRQEKLAEDGGQPKRHRSSIIQQLPPSSSSSGGMSNDAVLHEVNNRLFTFTDEQLVWLCDSARGVFEQR